MDWAEVVNHPSLQDIPFKIETNEFGEIVMNPVKINHSIFQGRISALLQIMRPASASMVECAIRTSKGTKVADVAWASMEVIEKIQDETEASIAPEICVEVISRSNTETEMREKATLYFERGAIEVWTCDESGNIRFFDKLKEMEKSEMFSKFPNKVQIKAGN